MQNDTFHLLKRPLSAAALICCLLLGLWFLNNRGFHVSGTNPGLKSVAVVAPFIKIDFNKPLSPRGISVSSSYNVVKGYKIAGKTLVVTLDSPMTAGYAYNITINRISSVSGLSISNKTLVFTPKDIAWQDLPKDEQQALLLEQANRPRTINDINFTGTDALLSAGLTSDQIAALEQYFFDFDPKASSVAIDQSSVAVASHDRNSSSTTGSINLSVRVDNKSYGAMITYQLDLAAVSLSLHQADGTMIYNSDTANKIQGDPNESF